MATSKPVDPYIKLISLKDKIEENKEEKIKKSNYIINTILSLLKEINRF